MRKLLISLFLCIGTQLYSQSIQKFSIDSGGASIISGNLEILYTVGEVNLQEYHVNNLYISEGFIDNLILGTLGINDKFSSEYFIHVYPNPVSEFIYIKSNFPINNIEIYNILGSKVLETTSLKIDASNFQSGMYLIKINSEKGQETKRVIKL